MQQNIKEIRQKKVINDFFIKYPITKYKFFKKTITVQQYSNKKVNLCYEKLKKPKINYMLHYMKDNKEYIIDCPKIVYNSLNIEEDIKRVILAFKYLEDHPLNRLVGKDYMHMNFLKESEKETVHRIELYKAGKYNELIGVV